MQSRHEAFARKSNIKAMEARQLYDTDAKKVQQSQSTCDGNAAIIRQRCKKVKCRCNDDNKTDAKKICGQSCKVDLKIVQQSNAEAKYSYRCAECRAII